ncbi:MAG: AMP-binding protein, partial [Solobacterium sp.]|nr:AMP-binding protein [Solobacterium sp.]
MKLSFSTRGWSSLPFRELTDIAEEMQFAGFELYDLFKYPHFTARGGALDPYSVNATMRSLRDRSIEIANLDTSLDLSQAESLNKILWTISMARDMRVGFVSAEAMHDDEEQIRTSLDQIVEAAKKADVTFLIKTRGIYVDTERLKDLLDIYAEDSLGVLWDLHHPYKDHGESADTTIRNLGGYVKLVHIRDYDESGSYTIMGEGKLPVQEMMRALSSIDYDGFITLEWKPEWVQDVQDYSFIFPHFISYMRRFERQRANRTHLYKNHDGTGEYIWKKDELINLTFPQVLDRVVEEFPDQYAFKYTTLDYTRTYEQFRDDVDTFARALVSLGVKAGSKVAIWATNVPAWYITFWATTKIGAVLVTVNTAYKIHEAEYLFRQSDTHTLVMIESALDSNYREIINEICPEIQNNTPGEPLHCKRLPFLRNVITVGVRSPGCLTFEEAMARAPMVPKEKILWMASRVSVHDVCNMQYTSGTTGFPKGV